LLCLQATLNKKICVIPSSAGIVIPLETADDLTDNTIIDYELFTERDGTDILLSEGMSAISLYVSVYIA